MKYLLLFLLLALPVMAQIEHSLPTSAQAGDDLSVAIQVSGAIIGEKVLVGEKIPPNATIRSWNVAGASESKEKIGFYNEGRIFVWSFTAATSRPSISYVITLPNATKAEFTAVYALPPTNIGQDQHTINLVSPTANVIIQSPTSTQRSSINWLVIIIALLGLVVGSMYYGPELKYKMPQFKKIDVQKIEGDFSSWLHERIDHHKERIAQKPTSIQQPQFAQHVQNTQFQMPQMSAQAAQENDALEQINTQASKISNQPESIAPTRQFENYRLPQFEQKTTSYNSQQTNTATTYSESLPIISLDEQPKPLRPEDFNESQVQTPFDERPNALPSNEEGQSCSQYSNQEEII